LDEHRLLGGDAADDEITEQVRGNVDPSAVRGAVYVVMNSDSPPSVARFSDFRRPPSILASSCTPADVAIMAPASTFSASRGASITRATAKLGLWRTVTSIR
jgi:hypothetical protein